VRRLFRTSLAIVLLSATVGHAQSASVPEDEGFWQPWFRRSDKVKDTQPHWVTPLVTTTPRLEQEFRSDVLWQQTQPGAPYSVNLGNSKGLELIPLSNVEIIVGVPPYIVHNSPTANDGFGDLRFLAKYRLAAAPETRSGGYIVTAFLDVSVPTGSAPNGQPKPIVTSTLAYGKGAGAFDLQGTIAIATPTSDVASLGRTYTWNNAFQYHLARRLWPQVEINAAWFDRGKNDGRHQVYITPGFLFGRTQLTPRLGLTVGAGVQIAVSDFHTAVHSPVVSVRLPF
jgi:hypothetical protein